MKVWAVTWDTYCDSDDHSYPEWEVFESCEAAEASCPTNGRVTELEVRANALAVETRYQVRSNHHFGDDEVPEIYDARKYVVNEMQEDFGKPLVEECGWWLNGPSANSASRDEALAFVRERLAPEIQHEKERLDRIATWTHQFRCPDHGDLSMGAPDSSRPCMKCHRHVDASGRRFGHYVNVPHEGPREPGTIYFNVRMSVGGKTDHDLGPLPDEELAAVLARSSSGE